jgi:Xaa-Pro dipeptidase
MIQRTPVRGFPAAEFEARVARAQAEMHAGEMDGIVLTTPQNFRYFSGFNSQFWESPTRPFFLVVPREENLVITEDGCELLTRRAPV